MNLVILLAVVGVVAAALFLFAVKLLSAAVVSVVAENRMTVEAALKEYRSLLEIVAIKSGVNPHHVDPTKWAPSGISMDLAEQFKPPDETAEAKTYDEEQAERAREHFAELQALIQKRKQVDVA